MHCTDLYRLFGCYVFTFQMHTFTSSAAFRFSEGAGVLGSGSRTYRVHCLLAQCDFERHARVAQQLPESQWQPTCAASSASRCQGLQVSCHIQKSLQNHGQSLAMMSAYRNVFVIFYRWLQKGGFQFNEGFWLCSADGQSCICGFRWWPTEWLSQGLICSTHEPCTFTVYILSLFHTVRLTVGFLFCDWSFTGGWCVAILILNVLRDKFNYHYE